MSKFKRHQVVMLSTNEKAQGDIRMSLLTSKLLYKDNTATACNVQHLYILSNESIKVNDHFYNPHSGRLHLAGNHTDLLSVIANGCMKVISTTDSSLGLPKPSQDFIRKYIDSYNKNNIITEVMVEYEQVDYISVEGKDHLKFTLKVNTHTNTVTLKKLQESWNREGIRAILLQFARECGQNEELYSHYAGEYKALDNWIEENLR